ALAMHFPPSAACKTLDLPPVNLRVLPLRLTKNALVIAPPHLCGIVLRRIVTNSSRKKLEILRN
ncbi:MAG: hypothetical protein SOX38_03470, partial [Candidatus Limiplasma sp.]|nr:hypothetical protein [Candidatus Limiplasma sp.]